MERLERFAGSQCRMKALAPGWTAATTTAAFTCSHGARLINHQRAAHQILAMAGVHGPPCGCIVVYFTKHKPPSLSGETIAHDGHRIDRHAIIGKEVL